MIETLPAAVPVVPQGQEVDPIVSRSKFDRELDLFRRSETHYRERGVLLLRAEFPVIMLAFCAFRVRPLTIAFAVKLDFTNYDLIPPSLKFIDPITERELRRQELGVRFLRVAPPTIQDGQTTINPPQDLIAAHEPEFIPFLCLAGIREYHYHPLHSNDPWMDYKGKGEGSLGFIIDQLTTYGTEPISGVMPRVAQLAVLQQGAIQVQYGGIVFTTDKVPK